MGIILLALLSLYCASQANKLAWLENVTYRALRDLEH